MDVQQPPRAYLPDEVFRNNGLRDPDAHSTHADSIYTVGVDSQPADSMTSAVQAPLLKSARTNKEGSSAVNYSQPAPPPYIFGGRPDFQSQTNRLLERANIRARWTTVPEWARRIIQILCYLGFACIIYFAFVGVPLWHGIVYSLWYGYQDSSVLVAGASIFVGVGFLYAIAPMMRFFEKEANPDEKERLENVARAEKTALIIPCHKSAEILPPTLEAALKTFPGRNIFIIDNSRSATPPDNTIDVCKQYGVRHIYVPVASKIAAQFIGVQAAFEFEYILMIDDDVKLPDYFPVVIDRIEPHKEWGGVKCVGYAIKSVGANGTPGSMCQQAQSIEYLRAGLLRDWLGTWASAVFPHGAISLWDRPFLEKCFRKHPGFTISEDWFLGHVCRSMKGRVKMCSSVIVETETPVNLVRNGEGSRAGYGEMTVTKQRLERWNFFIVHRIWYDAWYILFRWGMFQYEFGTKLYVFQEIYQTLLLMFSPVIMPVVIGARPEFGIPIVVAVILMYYIITAIINEVHFRRRGVRVASKVVYLYFPFYMIFLGVVNVASTYLAIFNYARYFTGRHPKVHENEEILKVMLALSQRPYDTEFDMHRDLPPEVVQQHRPETA